MVFGAGIPEGRAQPGPSQFVQSYRAIFTRNSRQKKEEGRIEKGGRQERNGGDDLSPSFCSPLTIYTSSSYLSLPRFSFVRYSSSFSLLSSFHGTLGRAMGKAREWLSSHGLSLHGYEFSFG